MHTGNYQFRATFFSFPDVGTDFCLVDIIYNHFFLRLYAIRTIRIIKERYFHTFNRNYIRRQRIALRLTAICAYMRNTHFVEHIERPHQPGITPVKAMVVGMEKQIEPGISQRHGKTVGRAETRIAGVGLTAKRAFQINDSIIGTFHVIRHIGETRGIIIHTTTARRRNLPVVLHGIAGKHQRNIASSRQILQQRQQTEQGVHRSHYL